MAFFLVSCLNVAYPEDDFNVLIKDCGGYKYSKSGKLVYIVFNSECDSQKLELTLKKRNDTLVVLLEPNEEKEIKLDEEYLKVNLFKENTWRKLDNHGSWSQRDGAGALVFKDKVYLLGGWNHQTVVNEVWVTDDLLNWVRLPDAPWEPRHGAGWLIHKDKMYVVSGDLIEDVWSSADGINWTQLSREASFGQRYAPTVLSTGEYIYLYGGQYWDPVRWCHSRPDCIPVAPKDVWRSKDGAMWEKVLDDAPWSGRALVHGSLFFDNQMFLLGGGLKNATTRYSETYTEFSDVWTSKNGRDWEKRDVLTHPGRTHFSVLATSHGCYISDGSVGTQSNVSNELYFAQDCLTYKNVEVPEGLRPRHASSLFEFNGSIVLLGGLNAGTTIWQYFPKNQGN